MADEIAKTDPTAGPKQDPNAGFPEPVILEERIVAVPPKKTEQAPAQVSAPASRAMPQPGAHAPAPTPAAPQREDIQPLGVIKPPASFLSHREEEPLQEIASAPAEKSIPVPVSAAAPSPSEEVGLWKPPASDPTAIPPLSRKPTPGPAVTPIMSVMPKSAEGADAKVPVAPVAERETRIEPSSAPEPELRASAPEPKRIANVQDITLHPAAASLQAAAVSSAQDPMRNDIANILKEIKLPERHEIRAAADPKPRVIENKPISLETPAQAPAAPTTVDKAPSEKHQEIVTPVHTLKDDLQDVVREKKISLVRAAALEEDKRRGQEHFATERSEAASRRSRRTRAILFIAVILFVLGALALGGVLYVESERSTAPSNTQAQSSILFAEQTVGFPIDNQSPRDLKQLLAQTRTASVGSLGSITRIVPTRTETNADGSTTLVPVTLQEFFTALGINAPDELMRAIGPDFFFGIHTVDKNAPIFVIPVTSYDHAFAGMLAWEPNMNADLAPIFTAVPALTVGSGGLPVARTFSDGILQNYDVRELKDDQGNVQLYYSFPTPNYLIIAESTYSFTEILSRLQAERKL